MSTVQQYMMGEWYHSAKRIIVLRDPATEPLIESTFQGDKRVEIVPSESRNLKLRKGPGTCDLLFCGCALFPGKRMVFSGSPNVNKIVNDLREAGIITSFTRIIAVAGVTQDYTAFTPGNRIDEVHGIIRPIYKYQEFWSLVGDSTPAASQATTSAV